MGCMGHPAMQGVTPNMDRLAQSGVLFRQAYSTCPVCNPSRASMWTGKYPSHYDCWNNNAGLVEGIPVLLDGLTEAGFRMSNFGKLDYQNGLHSVRDQVGSWTRTANILRPTNRMIMPLVLEEEAHPGDAAKVDKLIAELHQAAADSRPFFCTLSTALVHPSFVTNQRYLDRIDPDLVEIPPGLRDLSDDDHPVDRFVRITKNHPRAIPPFLAHEIRRVYYAMIAELDELVGRVLAAVDDLGLWDSTYIIFSSDHGEMACEHNQVLKRTFYEPAIHVPLIVSGPGVRSGAVVDDVVSLIDIYPTILDMARLQYGDIATDERWPERVDGESLMPQLQGDVPRQRDWAFGEYHGDRCPTGTYMLRRGRWKLLYHVDYEPQLFDLEADVWELNNVAADNPDVVREMEGIMRAHFDLEGIEQRARQYDLRRFRQWRDEQKRAGTYERTMALVYSGYSRLCLNDVVGWTDDDEQKIEEWLARNE